MKVSELIKELQKYPQDEEFDLYFNPCKSVSEEYDITCDIEVFGDTETSPTIMITPKDKPNDDFETVSELLNENPDKLTIEISTDGIYIESDGQLRREIDFLTNGVPLEDRTEDVIKRLIREL